MADKVAGSGDLPGGAYTGKNSKAGKRGAAERVVRQRREGLRELEIIPQRSSTLLHWIDDTLQKVKRNTAHINLLTNYLEAVWRERNQRIFQQQVSRTPISGLLKRTYQDIEAFPTRRSNEETLQQMRTAKTTVEGWMNTWDRRRTGRSNTEAEEVRGILATMQIEENEGSDSGPTADIRRSQNNTWWSDTSESSAGSEPSTPSSME
ncbi:hypothetical protein R1sor_000916 [Riccia sorocarpa]|uniref:Uncharacterized protein n=1 Tax=Riccia sorocarpa TaxID=122646 RepID=A0ABD3H0I4_9MARC